MTATKPSDIGAVLRSFISKHAVRGKWRLGPDGTMLTHAPDIYEP